MQRADSPFLSKVIDCFSLDDCVIRNWIINVPDTSEPLVEQSKGTENHLLHYGSRVIRVQYYPYNRNRLIIYAHGKSSKSLSLASRLILMAKNYNSSTLSFDYSNSEENQASQNSIKQDIEVVLQHAIGALEYQSRRILILGFSLGSIPALHLATKIQAIGVILLAPIASFKSIFSDEAQFYQQDNQLNSLKLIQKVRCKTMLLHSLDDSTVPYSNSLKLLKHFKRVRASQRDEIKMLQLSSQAKIGHTGMLDQFTLNQHIVKQVFTYFDIKF